MTSLIAWMGVDSRGPSSLYLASDSRISWQAADQSDFGPKVFACHTSPDVFGYCGDVLFPSLLLGQASRLIDLRLEADAGTAPEIRHEILTAMARTSFARFPFRQQRAFTILHGARHSLQRSSIFYLWRTDWGPETGWSDQPLTLPTESVLVLAVGSGASTVSHYDDEWRRSVIGVTSRGVFSAFCDALKSGRDRLTGGAPQLVAVYCEGRAEATGILYKGARYLLGLLIEADQAGSLAVEWRNELFERCDGHSMKRLPQAQRHSRPSRRQSSFQSATRKPG